jgi:hypothetical protein
MRGLLEAKRQRTFGDQVHREDIELRYRYKMQVIASDVTERRLLVLHRDPRKLGIEDSDDIDVALTVLMISPSSSSRCPSPTAERAASTSSWTAGCSPTSRFGSWTLLWDRSGPPSG